MFSIQVPLSLEYSRDLQDPDVIGFGGIVSYLDQPLIEFS